MFSEVKKRYCSLCDSSHCPEANIDYTLGCCICFATNEVEHGIKPIKYCYYCEKHNGDKGKDLFD